jgi:acyl carrier protein
MPSLDQRVQRVFREVFDDEQMQINDQISPKTYPAWDSFAQVQLIMGLEQEFEVKFETREVLELQSVSSFKRSLVEKGAGQS